MSDQPCRLAVLLSGTGSTLVNLHDHIKSGTLPATIAVVAPTARGVDRMKALVSQYYAGPLLTPDLDSGETLDGVDVLVHPRAIEMDGDLVAGVSKEIVIDWELDPGSTATFLSRLAAAVR